MSVSRPESFILSLFDSVDALADYCMANNDQKDVIVEDLLAKRKDTKNAMPGMVCAIDRQQ